MIKIKIKSANRTSVFRSLEIAECLIFQALYIDIVE